LVNYSQALFDIGRTEEAFATLERGKDVPAVRNQKGNLLYAAGRYEEALAEYETALRGEPGNRTYLENAADAALRCGLFSRAEALYARLLEETGDPSWCFQLAVLRSRRENTSGRKPRFAKLSRGTRKTLDTGSLSPVFSSRGRVRRARGLLDIPADSPYAGMDGICSTGSRGRPRTGDLRALRKDLEGSQEHRLPRTRCPPRRTVGRVPGRAVS
jgi:tetratricopeptide (TPR) repeat protein